MNNELDARSESHTGTTTVLSLALAGNDQANLALGKRYYRGDGVKKEFTVSRWFFDRVDNGAKPEAAFYLGNIYASGAGVIKNCARAERYYRYSAGSGYEPAVQSLSKLNDLCA